MQQLDVSVLDHSFKDLPIDSTVHVCMIKKIFFARFISLCLQPT